MDRHKRKAFNIHFLRMLQSYRKCSLFLITMLLAYGFLSFLRKYAFSGDSFDSLVRLPGLDRNLFVINWTVFFSIFVFFLYLSYAGKKIYERAFCIVISLVFLILATYTIDDIFLIKYPLFVCYLLACSAIFSGPVGALFMLAGSCFFVVFQYHYSFMGAGGEAFLALDPDPLESAGLAFQCLFCSCGMIGARYFFISLKQSQAKANHLNNILNQMGDFNRALQENAMTTEEKAAEKERLRVTREIHDSAGYVFVNIIALMDAVISGGCQNQSEELFETVRKQASDGLQETRRILRKLRAVEERTLTSIESIYRLKVLFETTTNIAVDVEAGNAKKDYGPEITYILTRCVQEAFTNAVRHGHATHILIHLWQIDDYLSMTVTDNGSGSKGIVKGIGLAGMEERLSEINGTLSASTPVEGGFRIEIRIPIKTNH